MVPTIARSLLILTNAIGVFSWVVAPATAAPLPKGTGYTRPGIGKAAGEKEIAMGVTVYFQVYDRESGTEEDPWQTGAKDLAANFVAGRGAEKGGMPRGLDLSARYLYVYQVMNDGGRQGRVTAFTIPIEPALVTSFGHLVHHESGNRRGLGFAVESREKKREKSSDSSRPENRPSRNNSSPTPLPLR